ncbi:hypothetical protein OPV22_014616 [Ensete ventricosum]|uniref:Uncharacterized protein n=1 Tax=Ensete ventricosum TaxID=4639 RepID=A0AAV8RB11_ENSVE|nr:hypothetical protein OPV22_014616 [Ensete ventricosum]
MSQSSSHSIRKIEPGFLSRLRWGSIREPQTPREIARQQTAPPLPPATVSGAFVSVAILEEPFLLRRPLLKVFLPF